MRYIETTTLFNLHAINYKALITKIRNSKKNIMINMERLMPFLKLLQAEAMIVNKVDCPLSFEFKVSAETYPVVTLKFLVADKSFNILPHICNKAHDLEFSMGLNDFNKYDLTSQDMLTKACVAYSSRLQEDISCSWITSCMLEMIRKVDQLLNYDKKLYQMVLNKGIYPEKNKLSYDCFDLEISKKDFSIASKAKNRKIVFQNLFAINIDLMGEKNLSDILVRIDIHNQTIKLTYDEFLNAEISDIENMIVMVLKLKSVNVANMDELKRELILHDMVNI
jgi:hypothetical protein